MTKQFLNTVGIGDQYSDLTLEELERERDTEEEFVRYFADDPAFERGVQESLYRIDVLTSKIFDARQAEKASRPDETFYIDREREPFEDIPNGHIVDINGTISKENGYGFLPLNLHLSRLKVCWCRPHSSQYL